MSRLLLKLEDFRLLPLFVLISMAAGILIGNALSISDFALTPPIDAIKSIAAGTFEPTVPALISLGVPIGLFAMMYPAMTNVRLGEVGIGHVASLPEETACLGIRVRAPPSGSPARALASDKCRRSVTGSASRTRRPTCSR